uniref:Small ribosomal subunit protein uS2c n=1 Tax=Hildenbrandia rivularis TaxID=135206 RepID=A0A1C9CFB7_9FLOR|nr:ribosomal protein S2 [Hildenbrandia rivularis]AOM67100.1 ribosomal protein S2 [Hildenbrandia rivularis]
MSIVTLQQLLEAGVHFGHQAKRWNPKMFPYIYAEKNGIHIIDLVQTSQLLTEAYQFVKKASAQGKRFLFLGTKRQASAILKQEAQKCNAYYVNQRWLGGMLTNWITVKSRIERLKELEKIENTGAIECLPKKEASVLKRELNKLRRHLSGVKYMQNIPDVVIIVDQKRENTAVQECLKLGISTICILDTNCNPELVDIPIPANDDAIRSIKLIIEKMACAINEGRNLIISNNN